MTNYASVSRVIAAYKTVASQAEMDHFHYLRRQTQARVLRSCSGEMEREVHSILGPLGIKETLSRLVAEDLREVEDSMYVGGNSTSTSYGTSTEGVVRIRTREDSGSGSAGGKKEKKWWRRLAGGEEREALLEQGGEAEKGDEDMGMTAFLLKFGEGMGMSNRYSHGLSWDVEGDWGWCH